MLWIDLEEILITSQRSRTELFLYDMPNEGSEVELRYFVENENKKDSVCQYILDFSRALDSGYGKKSEAKFRVSQMS